MYCRSAHSLLCALTKYPSFFPSFLTLGRSLRCDHIDEYKLPKDVRTKELELLQQKEEKGPSDVDIDIGPGLIPSFLPSIETHKQ